MHIVRHQPVASSALLRRNVHAHPRIGQRHTGRCARASQLERARSPHTQFCSVADCYSVSERHLHTQGCFSVKASKLALRREVFPRLIVSFVISSHFEDWSRLRFKWNWILYSFSKASIDLIQAQILNMGHQNGRWGRIKFRWISGRSTFSQSLAWNKPRKLTNLSSLVKICK